MDHDKQTRPKTSKWGAINVAWGRARTGFIRNQIAQGRTYDAAKHNWDIERRLLKNANINYPPAWMHTGRKPQADQSTRPENESVPMEEDEQDHMTPGSSRDTAELIRERRIKRAKELQARYKDKINIDAKLHNELDDDIEPQFKTNEKTPNKIQTYGHDTSTPVNNSEASGSDKRKVRFDLSDYIKGTPIKPNFTQQDTTEQPQHDTVTQHTGEVSDRITMATNMETNGIPTKRTNEGNSEDEPPPKLTPNQPPLNETQQSTGSGANPPGLNETLGNIGGGGGLAGAGNNQYFHGFAKSTVPRDPADYEYVDTYRRPWQVHTPFPDPDDVGSSISTDPVQYFDAAAAGPQGYPIKKYVGKISHRAIVIPYTWIEASMKDHDWNKPPDHIAYEVLEIGFDMPNLRLNIMNNPRTNVNDVAPAPPSDARMWTFIDLYNDYGIPIQEKSTLMSHNVNFTHEDFLTASAADYELPTLGERIIYLDPAEAQAVQLSRGWWPAGTTNTNADPHAIYDMKRHPGYKEFILSEGKLGMSYKVHAPIVRLPHQANSTLDTYVRQPATTDWDYWGSSPASLHQWPTTNMGELYGQETTDDNHWQGTQTQFYIANQSGYGKQIGDNMPLGDSTTVQFNYQQSYGDKRVLPAGNPAISLPYTACVTRPVGRYSISDDGSVMLDHISHRPPLFLIGIYKEFEYRQDTPEYWRYYLYGQIEYWVKIKWYVQPMRNKVYIPIGLGGVYSSEEIDGAIGNRYNFINWQRNFRKTMKPLLHTTAKEPLVTATYFL